MRNVAALGLSGLWGALLAGAAHACPVCFSATDGNRMAFLGTTVLLSLLPLGMLAGGVLYLRRRARQLDEEDTRSAP